MRKRGGQPSLLFLKKAVIALSLGKSKHAEQKKRTFIAADLFYWAEALVLALTFLVILSVFFVRFSGVDGSSMLPTLVDREQVLVRVFGYDEPERGDIVVIYAPYYENEPLVKRVIAKGGDVVDIDPASGAVSVNGEELYEPYILEAIRDRGAHEYPYTVPEGHVFVMGDNRNGSSDSRRAEIGALPYENIIGKVFFRVFPFSRIGRVQ